MRRSSTATLKALTAVPEEGLRRARFVYRPSANHVIATRWKQRAAPNWGRDGGPGRTRTCNQTVMSGRL